MNTEEYKCFRELALSSDEKNIELAIGILKGQLYRFSPPQIADIYFFGHGLFLDKLFKITKFWHRIPDNSVREMNKLNLEGGKCI